MKQIFFTTRSLSSDGTTLMARIIPGTFLFYLGVTKILNYHQYKDYFPDPIGIGNELSLVLVIGVEAVCGLLLTIGLLSRMVLIPIFITMSVALFIAHAGDPFAAKQPAILIWLLTILSFITGPGRYSIDHILNETNIESGEYETV